MKQLGQFKTTHTLITLFDAEEIFLGTHLYAIKSVSKRKELIRFGNAQQILNILETYWTSVMWNGDERNEMNRLAGFMQDRARKEGF